MKLKQNISIGHNLAYLREQANFTQERLAAEMQLYGCLTTRNTYAQMEGGTYNIRISELLVLREIYDCSIEDFFMGLPRPQKLSGFEVPSKSCKKSPL